MARIRDNVIFGVSHTDPSADCCPIAQLVECSPPSLTELHCWAAVKVFELGELGSNVLMHQMAAVICAVIISWALPVREDMIPRMPELVLLGRMYMTEPPVDHLTSAVALISRSGSMVHPIYGNAISRLQW